jgi:hypothetical protein
LLYPGLRLFLPDAGAGCRKNWQIL